MFAQSKSAYEYSVDAESAIVVERQETRDKRERKTGDKRQERIERQETSDKREKGGYIVQALTAGSEQGSKVESYPVS